MRITHDAIFSIGTIIGVMSFGIRFAHVYIDFDSFIVYDLWCVLLLWGLRLMVKKRKSDIELKLELENQIQKLKDRQKEIDQKRCDKIGKLAFKFGINNLEDAIIESEFEAIKEKYKDNLDLMQMMDEDVKK